MKYLKMDTLFILVLNLINSNLYNVNVQGPLYIISTYLYIQAIGYMLKIYKQINNVP